LKGSTYDLGEDMNFKAILATGAVSLALSMAVSAHAAVVTFDDVSGQGTVADGYGGVIWDSNWTYYDAADGPYSPASGASRVYVNYSNHDAGVYEAVGFRFAGPVVFDGAYFAGQFNLGISFQMYLGGVQVAVSNSLDQTSTPAFLASGYAGQVDEVRVYGSNDYYVMDDVTYTAAPAPEPAVWALMIVGFGLTGVALRGRRSATA
jgi:hypothetical protein